MASIPTIADVAAVLALAPNDSPWKHEAPVRHALRRLLLLNGWRSWWAADFRAHGFVARGRIFNGVRTPTGWDHDNDLSTWLGTIECAICGKTVIQRIHNQVYCSQVCKSRANYIGATKQRLLRCSRCGDLFEGRTVEAKYCSSVCRQKIREARNNASSRQARAAAAGIDLDERRCVICSRPIPEGRNIDAVLCGATRCLRDYHNLWRREQRRRAKANGANGHATNGHAHDPEDDHRSSARVANGASGAPGAQTDPPESGDGSGRVARVDAASTAR